MKKLLAIVLVMLLLSGCSSLERLLPARTTAETLPSSEAPAAVETTAPEQAAAQPAVPTGKVISPLPSTIDLENLGDCILAVGFTEKTDAYMNEGRFEIRMDVYEAELFDLVDMAQLAPGDTLMISGEAVLVETLTEENGAKLINGGLEAGGYTFYTSNDGVFFRVFENDRMDYRKVGQITIPVGQDFTLVDNSSLEEKVTYPGDLLAEAPNSDTVYRPDNTRAHVADGCLQNITVSYLP